MDHDFYELRVKRSTLAAELRIIKKLASSRLKRARQLKVKFGDDKSDARTQYGSLSGHVVGLKKEARSAHLASMFLKGVARQDVEHPLFTRSKPDRERVQVIAERFSTEDKRVVAQNFAEWWDNYTTQEARTNHQMKVDAARHEQRVGKPERNAANRKKWLESQPKTA